MSAPLEVHTFADSGEPPIIGTPTTLFFSWVKSPRQPDDDDQTHRITVAGVKNASGILFLMVTYHEWSGAPADMETEASSMALMSEYGYERLHATLPLTHHLSTGQQFQQPNGVSPNWEMMRAQEPGPQDVPFSFYGSG